MIAVEILVAVLGSIAAWWTAGRLYAAARTRVVRWIHRNDDLPRPIPYRWVGPFRTIDFVAIARAEAASDRRDRAAGYAAYRLRNLIERQMRGDQRDEALARLEKLERIARRGRR